VYSVSPTTYYCGDFGIPYLEGPKIWSYKLHGLYVRGSQDLYFLGSQVLCFRSVPRFIYSDIARFQDAILE